MTTTDTRSIARAYIEAVSAHELEPLEDLLDHELTATFSGDSLDKTAWIAALNRLMPALLRNEIQEIFATEDRACVVYDFVTNTQAGAIRCVELLTVANGKILDVELILDRLAFAPVNTALRERVAQAR
jgi:ketosteroid isomerase-like protein